MPLTKLETMVNRMEQTLYGDNGSGLRAKVDKLDSKLDKVSTKITHAGGIFVGIQLLLGIIISLIMIFGT